MRNVAHMISTVGAFWRNFGHCSGSKPRPLVLLDTRSWLWCMAYSIAIETFVMDWKHINAAAGGFGTHVPRAGHWHFGIQSTRSRHADSDFQQGQSESWRLQKCFPSFFWGGHETGAKHLFNFILLIHHFTVTLIITLLDVYHSLLYFIFCIWILSFFSWCCREFLFFSCFSMFTVLSGPIFSVFLWLFCAFL